MTADVAIQPVGAPHRVGPRRFVGDIQIPILIAVEIQERDVTATTEAVHQPEIVARPGATAVGNVKEQLVWHVGRALVCADRAEEVECPAHVYVLGRAAMPVNKCVVSV